MGNELQPGFSVDRENNSITVTSVFEAPLQKVWLAWTERDRLDEWWAPAPYMAKTKIMYFNDGGYWLYSMTGPGGDEQWCRADYLSIKTLQCFSWRDSFCDESGKIMEELPQSIWTNDFDVDGNDTVVRNRIQFDDGAQLDHYLKMGFEEGFKTGLNNLAEYLKAG